MTTVDRIVADLRAGGRLRDIARRHKFTEHEVRRIASQHGITRTQRNGPAKRPERPCTWCGRTTVAKDRTCAACAAIHAKAAHPGDDAALVGGRWVRHGLILRWQPDPTQEEAA